MKMNGLFVGCGFLIGWVMVGMVFTPVATAIAPDAYEEDDTYGQASIIVLNDPTAQTHNFHDVGDQDWVMFYGLHGDPTITYQVETVNLGADCDTRIEVYDTDGVTMLTYVDDKGAGRDEFLEWDCPAEGVYYIKVRHYDETYDPDVSGDDTVYDLKVSRSIGPGPGWIEGTTTDAGNASPLPGVRLSTSGDGSGISHTSGDYEIYHASGTYTLTAKKDGYNDYTKPGVTVVEGATVIVDVPMVKKNDGGTCAAVSSAEASTMSPIEVRSARCLVYLAFPLVPVGVLLLLKARGRKRT